MYFFSKQPHQSCSNPSDIYLVKTMKMLIHMFYRPNLRLPFICHVATINSKKGPPYFLRRKLFDCFYVCCKCSSHISIHLSIKNIIDRKSQYFLSVEIISVNA